MVKCIVDTQVHHILYVACVGSNNHLNIDYSPNWISWLDHIIINDEVHCLTPRLGWIEHALYWIVDTFANTQFWEIPQVTIAARDYESPLKGIAVSLWDVFCLSLSVLKSLAFWESNGPTATLVVLLVRGRFWIRRNWVVWETLFRG